MILQSVLVLIAYLWLQTPSLVIWKIPWSFGGAHAYISHSSLYFAIEYRIIYADSQKPPLQIVGGTIACNLRRLCHWFNAVQVMECWPFQFILFSSEMKVSNQEMENVTFELKIYVNYCTDGTTCHIYVYEAIKSTLEIQCQSLLEEWLVCESRGHLSSPDHMFLWRNVCIVSL